MTSVSGYTTRSGKRVSSYSRNGESLGGLRRSSPRFRPRVAGGAMLNAIIPGREERRIKQRKLQMLHADLRHVRSGRRGLSPVAYGQSQQHERAIMREIHKIRHGSEMRSSLEVGRQVRTYQGVRGGLAH